MGHVTNDGTGTIRVLVVGPKHPSGNSRGGMATVVGLMREHHDDRVQITTVATYVDDRVSSRLATAVWGLARATALIMLGRVDVVHVHLAHKGSVARKSVPLLAARLRGVPAVVHAHSYDFASWFDTLPGWARAVVRRLLPAEQWLVLGDGLVASYQERLRVPPAAIRSFRNPAPLVQPARPVADEPAGTPVRAVALGRMGHRKGTYDLLDALDRLGPDARRSLRVVLAGDGEVEEVRAAIVRRGLGDVVEARSWLAAPERDALLRSSDVFLLPSHAEGLPMAMLEAMASGLVPVVGRVGAVAEVAHDDVNALLVDPGDPAVLATAIESLVLDAELRRRLATAARATAGGLSVDVWFDDLVDVWTHLVEDGPHRVDAACSTRAG